MTVDPAYPHDPQQPSAFSSDHLGLTSALDWREWLDATPMPPPLPSPAGRILVVSAHPDDEVLGAGGFISDAVSGGAHVTVLCLSDGAASHPGSPTISPAALAITRRRELGTALAALGVNCVIHRDLPDGYLEECTDSVEKTIADTLAACGGHDLVVTVWRADRHPDHDAVGRAAARVAGRIGVEVLEYPVWMWHWAQPDDASVPWASARSHRLSPAALRAKRRAVHAFTSQITDLSADPADRAILAPHVLDRLTGPTETFFAANRHL